MKLKKTVMIRQLHILVSIEQPQVHLMISQLDSQLIQLFIESKGAKQTKIEGFYRKTASACLIFVLNCESSNMTDE